MGPAAVAEREREARARLEFVAKLYRSRLERRVHFRREHLATASSWSEQRVKDLLNEPEVSRGAGHMCRFGMRVSGPGLSG
eukprot:12874475-Alexandrium_andersonii.AAC.1